MEILKREVKKRNQFGGLISIPKDYIGKTMLCMTEDDFLLLLDKKKGDISPKSENEKD